MNRSPTIWDLLATCVRQLDEPFRASEIVGWFRRHHPEVKEQSLRAHIQSATSNASVTSKHAGYLGRTPLLTRIDHGVYTRFHADATVAASSTEDVTRSPTVTPPPTVTSSDEVVRAATASAPPAPNPIQTQVSDVILVGCTRSKQPHPSPARDLFTGPRFVKARGYAEQREVPWFVLSAKWGVLEPHEPVAPYDVYLADQPEGYRAAWGAWAAAQLERLLGPLRGRVVEVHASQGYVDPLREPLTRAGATLSEPLHGLRQGEQLAWYSEHDPIHSSAAHGNQDSSTLAPRHTANPSATQLEPVRHRLPDDRGGSRETVRPVVDALLRYGATHASSLREDVPVYTPVPGANELIFSDPFAFLLGVIFDQGITAERAWEAPYLLRQRLGHLSPERMQRERVRVTAAITMPPMLHRYVVKMPTWIFEAARIVTDTYGGDAGRIWAGTPSAAAVFRRLDDFPGIGQKKAAMAVNLLEHDLGVQMTDLHGSDIAFDVHVRRVFLRTGLAQHDDATHMIDAARRANPQRPSALDNPAWIIGRRWCHPTSPECDSCPLGAVCPKLINAASGVRGA